MYKNGASVVVDSQIALDALGEGWLDHIEGQKPWEEVKPRLKPGPKPKGLTAKPE